MIDSSFEIAGRPRIHHPATCHMRGHGLSGDGPRVPRHIEIFWRVDIEVDSPIARLDFDDMPTFAAEKSPRAAVPAEPMQRLEMIRAEEDRMTSPILANRNDDRTPGLEGFDQSVDHER